MFAGHGSIVVAGVVFQNCHENERVETNVDVLGNNRVDDVNVRTAGPQTFD